jgi:hypothetical protein
VLVINEFGSVVLFVMKFLAHICKCFNEAMLLLVTKCDTPSNSALATSSEHPFKRSFEYSNNTNLQNFFCLLQLLFLNKYNYSFTFSLLDETPKGQFQITAIHFFLLLLQNRSDFFPFKNSYQ